MAEPVIVVTMRVQRPWTDSEAADEVSLLPSLSAELTQSWLGRGALPLAARPAAFIVLRQLPRLSSDMRIGGVFISWRPRCAQLPSRIKHGGSSDHAVVGDDHRLRGAVEHRWACRRSKAANDAYDIDACDDGDGTTWRLSCARSSECCLAALA